MRTYFLCLLLLASIPAFPQTTANQTEFIKTEKDSLSFKISDTDLKSQKPLRHPSSKKKDGFDFVSAGQVFDFTLMN